MSLNCPPSFSVPVQSPRKSSIATPSKQILATGCKTKMTRVGLGATRKKVASNLQGGMMSLVSDILANLGCPNGISLGKGASPIALRDCLRDGSTCQTSTRAVYQNKSQRIYSLRGSKFHQAEFGGNDHLDYARMKQRPRMGHPEFKLGGPDTLNGRKS